MKRFCGLVLALAIAPAGQAADTPDDLAQLFPLRAKISASESGLSRAELSAEVIAACRADLADLRILGRDGREIPYIVDSPEPEGTAIAVEFRSRPEILAHPGQLKFRLRKAQWRRPEPAVLRIRPVHTPGQRLGCHN